jgi:hypothetical protein
VSTANGITSGSSGGVCGVEAGPRHQRVEHVLLQVRHERPACSPAPRSPPAARTLVRVVDDGSRPPSGEALATINAMSSSYVATCPSRDLGRDAHRTWVHRSRSDRRRCCARACKRARAAGRWSGSGSGDGDPGVCSRPGPRQPKLGCQRTTGSWTEAGRLLKLEAAKNGNDSVRAQPEAVSGVTGDDRAASRWPKPLVDGLAFAGQRHGHARMPLRSAVRVLEPPLPDLVAHVSLSTAAVCQRRCREICTPADRMTMTECPSPPARPTRPLRGANIGRRRPQDDVRGAAPRHPLHPHGAARRGCQPPTSSHARERGVR